ncbi:MAG TPA: hypothetical protein VF411_05050 [Bacteroidia bacterium]
MKRFLQLYIGFIFVFSFLLVLIITPLFQAGLFGDGIMYLTVAFNRFKGYGSFWQQHYSDTSMSFFCEQPPLYFEVLSWFYKLFGGAEIAERVFTIALLLLTVWLLSLIWKKLNGYSPFYKLSWLPSMLCILLPVFIWIFSNQVIETMIIPLTLLVFYVHLFYIKEPIVYKKTLWFLVIIGLLFMLLLTKGIQATFVLTILFCSALISKEKNVKALLIQNLLIALGLGIVCFLIFYFNSNANFWLTSYFNKRLVSTFHQVGATTDNHLEIIFRYLMEIIPLLLMIFFLSVYFKISTRYPLVIFFKNLTSNRTAIWLMLISLSGALPLALTLEQRGFYIAPAVPFAVLAFAYAGKRYFFVVFAKLNRRPKTLSAIAYSLLTISLLFFMLFKNDYKRDEGMLKDVALIKKIIPYGANIGFDKSMWNMFSLRSYLNKANNNNFLITDTTLFYVLNKDNKAIPPPNYVKLNYQTYWLDIYYKEKAK